MAADNWVLDGGASNSSKNTIDVYQAIQHITAAEHGKFFFDRDGDVNPRYVPVGVGESLLAQTRAAQP